MRIVTLSLTLVLFLLFPQFTIGEELMKIYFMPFNIDTYVPVSMNDIETKALHRLTIPAESELASELLRRLESHEQGFFDAKMVRLKVQTKGKTYYADAGGNIKVELNCYKANIKDLEETLNRILAKYGSIPNTQKSTDDAR